MQSEYKAPVGRGIYKINTGEWRTQRPVLDQGTCRACGICLMYCPVNSIRLEDGKYHIDYEYCKGCGVCANECPHDAISMEREVQK